jgi:hypothetical protein
VWRRPTLLDIGIAKLFNTLSLEVSKCHGFVPYNVHAQLCETKATVTNRR